MASIQFAGGKCHGAGEAKAMMRHADKDERLIHTHSNDDIQKNLTCNNSDLHGLSYQRMCDEYDAAIRGYQERSQKALRKDAVTLYDAIITVPKDLPADREDDWFRDVEKTINDHYGKPVVLDIKIHRDETHDYVDPSTKKTVTSRTHGHCFMFPDVDGRLSAKRFSSRANMTSLNREIHSMTIEKYQCQFLTGEKTVDRGFQTVEELKRTSDKEELLRDTVHARQEYQEADRDRQHMEEVVRATERECHDAQMQLDQLTIRRQHEQAEHDAAVKKKAAARADYDRIHEKVAQLADVQQQAERERDQVMSGVEVQKQLSQLSKDLTAQLPEIEIIKQTEEKTTLLGKVVPPTVTIKKADFDRLQETARKITVMQQVTHKMETLLDGIRAAARKMWTNSIDVTQIETNRRVKNLEDQLRASDQRVQELTHTAKQQEKTITSLHDQARILHELRDAFPKTLEYEAVLSYEMAQDQKPLNKKQLREYKKLCDEYEIKPREDMMKRLDTLEHSYSMTL